MKQQLTDLIADVIIALQDSAIHGRFIPESTWGVIGDNISIVAGILENLALCPRSEYEKLLEDFADAKTDVKLCEEFTYYVRQIGLILENDPTFFGLYKKEGFSYIPEMSPSDMARIYESEDRLPTELHLAEFIKKHDSEVVLMTSSRKLTKKELTHITTKFGIEIIQKYFDIAEIESLYREIWFFEKLNISLTEYQQEDKAFENHIFKLFDCIRKAYETRVGFIFLHPDKQKEK